MGCVGDYVACVGCVDCVTWGYLGARSLRKDRGIDRGVELVVGVGQFSAQWERASDMELIGGGDAQADTPIKSRGACDMIRSEERRVGKECRYRWSTEDYKKKEKN